MIATGLFVAIIGAVLVWAVEASVGGIDLNVAGWILLVAGAIMAIIGLAAGRAADHDYPEGTAVRRTTLR